MSTSKIIKVNATRSTNDKVKMLIKSKKIFSGDLIIAKYQYGGRGQRMNKWYSSYGKNLLCSLFYMPVDINADKTFIVNQAVSLAVLKTIRKFNNEKCLIKWPNDILSVNKKIAGIFPIPKINTATGIHATGEIGANIVTNGNIKRPNMLK